jgi:hypothetical protein
MLVDRDPVEAEGLGEDHGAQVPLVVLVALLRIEQTVGIHHPRRRVLVSIRRNVEIVVVVEVVELELVDDAHVSRTSS